MFDFSTRRRRDRTGLSSSAYTLEDLILVFRLKLREWDGGQTLVIVDQKERIIAVCVSRPEGDETWESTHQKGSEILGVAGDKIFFGNKANRRGNFSALSFGISYGGGQTHPRVLAQDRDNEEILEGLLKEAVFARMSGHAAAAFAQWAPRLYSYENEYLNKIITHDCDLRRQGEHPNPKEKILSRNWPKTPWAAATFNFGPQTVCAKHIDSRNLAVGWCAVTALGNFDYKKGGHLVLWELGLVIEFPAGSTILIPSAAIHHSNATIGEGENRQSFTQYTAGSIFSYVNSGYQTVKAYTAGLKSKGKGSAAPNMSKELEEGMALYSTLSELNG